MSKLQFENAVVLITGAASGTGKAVASAFAAQGAKLVIADVAAGARATVDELRSRGGEALFVETDVSNAASVEALVTSVLQNHGRIDVAFNNAGILPATAPLAEMPNDEFDASSQWT